jgi:hypothetical protein
MFDPDPHIPRANLSYFGACIFAGLGLAKQNQVNVRVIPIGESVEPAHDIYSRVFRKMPTAMEKVH